MTVFTIIKITYLIIELGFIGFVLFFERNESTRRLLWLFVLIVLPVTGWILYLLFSGHFFTGTKRMKETNKLIDNFRKPLIAGQRTFIEENQEKIQGSLVQKHWPLIYMNLTNNDSALVCTDNAEIFTTGDDFFESLYKDIENATQSVNMEYFIFKKDCTGKRFMDLLCKKAQEGVKVNLLYDDFGCFFTPTRFLQRLKRAGGEVHPFFQIRLGLPLTLNYRNHRKIAVIDGEIGYTGGHNIGDEYANKSHRYSYDWRDTTVRLTGSSVISLQSVFLIDWFSIIAWRNRAKVIRRAGNYYPKPVFDALHSKLTHNQQQQFFTDLLLPGRIPTQIITAGPNKIHLASIKDSLIKIISSAKKYVFIQTPYFTPDEEFLSALKIAAFSGVDVRILIPTKWDKFYMKAASLQFARELQPYGIAFYQYPGFIHAKTVTVDDEICSIGSTNIDCRSFSLLFEDNAIFYSEEFCKRHREIFEADAKKSRLIKKSELDKKCIPVRAWWSFAKLFTPLM
ncbi:MAG: cardiolipin synthase [Treponema sp.]|nr:cardiolipin synthase [Treponema sp.]